MRSNVLKFARQGLWPALSGGWYYDPNHSSFTNVFHMYTWILLLCLPFALYQTTVITWQVTVIYSVVLAVLICLIKFASSHLHKTFDIGEQMQRKTVPLEADKEQISENLSSGETRVRFQGAGDQADENYNQASFGDNNANEGAGHMHLWDEISKNPEFTDGDLFMKLQDDSNKTSKRLKENLQRNETANHRLSVSLEQQQPIAQVDVHHDDNFPVVMMPGTSADSTSGKRRRTRKKKARTLLDKCNSLPSVSSSDSEVSKTYNTQLSTPVASGDEKEENSPKSTNADGSPKQFRIQRKAGFRNRPRPKRPSAKDPSVDDFYSFASGDGIGPRKDSRKRNAPQDGTQGPQHKRSYSSADVESQRRHKEINKMSSVEQTKLELKKLKSQSLPSSSPSGGVGVDDVRLLLKSDEDTGENDDKSAKGDDEKPDSSPNTNNSLTSLSSDTSPSGCSLLESPGSDTKFIPSTVVIKKDGKGASKGKVSLSKSSDARVGASSSATLPIAAQPSKANKLTLEEFLNESSLSLKCPAPHHPTTDWEKYKPAKYFDSLSSDGEDGKVPWKVGTDTSAFPLLPLSGAAGPSSTNTQSQKNRRVTYNFAQRDSKDTSSGHSDDSEGQMMEENFQKCLQNFNKIPGVQRPKIYSRGRINRSLPSSSSSASRRRRLASSRSQSFMRSIADDVTTSDLPTTSRATSSGVRQRHPAGGDATEGTKERTSSDPSAPEGANPDEPMTEEQKLHFAKSHADTSEGAVHSFQDETGRWMTYTFSSDGPGVAYNLANNQEQRSGSVLRSRSASSRTRGDSSTSSVSNREQRPSEAEGATGEGSFDPFRLSSRRGRGIPFPEQQVFLDALRRSIENGQRMAPHTADASPPSITTPIELYNPEIRAPSPKVKIFYKMKLFGTKEITIQYDRLALLDLLDRNSHRIEVFISILFMVVVAFLGIQVLARNLLFDLWAFWFCVVIATSQFPLIRSVQPDSASPTHGYNRVIAYSRPFYFTICASLLILFNYLADESNVYLPGIPIYGVTLFDNKGCAMGRDFMLVFTLLLPVVFVCGLLPQVNTFVMYLCEQTEIHAFGGTASSSIFSSLFSVSRSILTVALLYGFCYGAAISKEGSQNILYSAFCGLLVAFSYHLSRQTSSPHVLWKLLKTRMFASSSSNNGSVDDVTERGDPSKEADDVGEKHEMNAVSERLQSDVVLCPTIALFTFAIHCSTAFAALQPALSTVLYVIAGVVGLVLHYLLPQLRKNLPWLFFSRPILKSKEHDLFEVTSEAQLMWYERVYAWLCFCEQNLLFPLIVLSLLSFESQLIVDTYGPGFGSLVLVVVGLKLLRSCFGVPTMQYLVISFSVLFVKYDARLYAPSVLVSYFFFGILFVKFQDLVLKLQFWMVYVAPWQITWGSAFHAFTQPFAVPHSAFLTAHAVLAALLQAPFAPFLGSALFLASYPRPLKFWERNYKTKRIDNSNTRLSTQLDRGPHSDDNNLNSIFYEHLTYSLQKSLAGDVTLGRWGNVYSGDCFILTSDNLNALVHLVELGNGIVTFQLRGLEFSGTYCHQREVEAINEGADDNDSCCCCRPGRIRGLLSFNSTFNQRWLAWEVLVSNYVLDGYSISDNNATTMLGVFDLRKILLNYIVKSIIFFLISHDSLVTWLEDTAIRDAVQPCEKSNYADVDSTFAVAIDDDYDVWLNGVSPVKFQEVYGDWIEHCVARRNEKDQAADNIDGSKGSKLVTLCFAISVLGRRALGTASHNFSSNLDAFLYGLHALFKGDFRITASKDEWIFSDMNLLHEVVAPGVRTAVKLHQDHFACPEDYDQPEALYDAISDYTQNMVIAHEGNPIWRKAVLSNTPSLLALRRVVSDTLVDQYSVITLNHRSLGFNIVKVNRESVRGLWAGQQNELVFLRNRNPERGSIQNAKQVLRNMINSSCDQPIGYPIYVSPLTSSYASTNQQLTRLLGGPITFKSVRNCFSRFVACLRQSCSGSCNSGGSAGMPVQQSVPLQSISRTSSRSAPIPAPGSRHPSLARGLHRPAPTKPPTPPQDPTFTTTAFTASGAAERVHRRVVSAVDMPATRVRHTSSLGGQKRASLAQDPLGDFPLGKLVFHSSASIAGSKKSDASFKRSRDSNEEPSESRRVTLLSSRPSASGSDVSDRRDNPSI